MNIVEGGNVFADAEPFDHRLIPQITQQINTVLSQTGAGAYPIGSGADPKPGQRSGDLDMIVDADTLANHFQEINIKAVRQKLRALFDRAGFQTAQSGVSVHVRTNIAGSAQQVDIMIVKNAKHAVQFHTHRIPLGSPYKGVHKHLLLSALARQQNLLWSPYEGLFTRDPQGKKNRLLTDDLDAIADTLLAPGADRNDLQSVETMLAKLPNRAAQDMLQQLSQDPTWQKKLQTESRHILRLKQLSGLI
jgi:hypothetical protein